MNEADGIKHPVRFRFIYFCHLPTLYFFLVIQTIFINSDAKNRQTNLLVFSRIFEINKIFCNFFYFSWGFLWGIVGNCVIL